MAVHDLCRDTRRKPEYNNAVHKSGSAKGNTRPEDGQRHPTSIYRPQYRLGRSLRVTLYGNFDIDVLHCAFDPQDKVRYMHEKQGIKLYQVRGDIYKNVRASSEFKPYMVPFPTVVPSGGNVLPLQNRR